MYNHLEIEKKWQDFWEKNKTYKTETPPLTPPYKGGGEQKIKPKCYTLIEFPYPSGTGLHVGHVKGQTAVDIYARFKRMSGFNVLNCIGWDAFGLPAENFAIKNKADPASFTQKNIKTFKEQTKSFGPSFDWDREVNTTDPKYYKWTQWIFLELFKAGLAYEKRSPINWCPSCKTGLANEEIINGKCERCDNEVEQKLMKQWFLAITKYADKLGDDLSDLNWPEYIKTSQKNWIGKSEGCEFEMELFGSEDKKISVFTTRIDTVFSMAFVVIAPDHIDINKFITKENENECLEYINKVKNKTNLDRIEGKEKTGIFTGSYIINPFNNEKVPLWIGDFVLGNYGTGAVMAVPAHDERDFVFAKKYFIDLKISIIPENESSIKKEKVINLEKPFCDDGILINSGDFNGLKSFEARQKLSEFAIQNGFGRKVSNYKLRDWLFSRQRYWGEPIPLIHLDEKDLESLEKIDTKKSENSYSIKEGVAHNGNTAKFSLCTRSIIENTEKVKKKDNKKLFNEIYQVIKTIKGEIIFDGQNLINHFSIKNRKEIDFRIKFGETILKYLDKIVYESENIGYIAIRSYIFRVVLEKIDNKKYKIKTYYSVLSYTKLFNKAYLKQEKDGDYLYIKGEKFSKIYDSIDSKLVIDNKLPLELPKVENYEPSGDGQSPLAKIDDFVNIKLADNLTGKRETNTMPQWAGSSWYFLRYIDPKNDSEFASKENLKYFMPVDIYFGGAEHTTVHLLYSRFWNKALYDLGIVPVSEPYKRRVQHGLIIGEDGRKMSKRWGNVINPDDVIKEYGADTMRSYVMFMGPYGDSVPWSANAIAGVNRFINRVYNLKDKIIEKDSDETIILLHKTIKKVSEDIESISYNTAISQSMIFVNSIVNIGITKESFKLFLQILAPFIPFITEELWNILGEKKSIHLSNWPEYDENLVKDNMVTVGIQVLGKVRGELTFNIDEDKDTVLQKAKNIDSVAKWLEGKEIIKEIYIPGRIINFVVK